MSVLRQARHTAFVAFCWFMAVAAIAIGGMVGSAIRHDARNIHFADKAGFVCAKALGISYTYEDGATEHLDAFDRCVEGRTFAVTTTTLH